MDNTVKALKGVLNDIIKIYEQLLEINRTEREYLVNADTANLSKTVEIKKYFALKIKDMEAEIKKLLDKHHVLKVSELISLSNKLRDIDELRTLEKKAKSVMEKYREKEKLNRMITAEHTSFYNSMSSMYASIIQNSNRNYKDNASIENIDYNRMNVRV